MDRNFSAMYRTRQEDPFPDEVDITLRYPDREITLPYKKVSWSITEDGKTEERGLRYGENPHQKAALYRYNGEPLEIEGLGKMEPIRGLSSDLELLQSGKHPGKINVVDVDRALQILSFLKDQAAAVIMKHNNPCGVARGKNMVDAITRARQGDIIAAFGGALVVNRPLDEAEVLAIGDSYFEIVAAPDFTDQALELLSGKKNLRIFRIKGMDRLSYLAGRQYLEFTALMDGGLVLQNSYSTAIRSTKNFISARNERNGAVTETLREAEPRELEDLLFGWFVESGVTSNSVIFIKDGATLAIGTGEQDRVGVVKSTIRKAYRNMAETLSLHWFNAPYNSLCEADMQRIDQEVTKQKGGLSGSVMVSDGFFPFRDGVDAALQEGITAIAEPGGSLRDGEVIQACNERGAALVFTGERSFRH